MLVILGRTMHACMVFVDKTKLRLVIIMQKGQLGFSQTMNLKEIIYVNMPIHSNNTNQFGFRSFNWPKVSLLQNKNIQAIEYYA